MFGVKDPIPRGLRAGVVNKFLCAGCNACYVGETTWHFSTCVNEHVFSDHGHLTFLNTWKIFSKAALNAIMTVSVS